MAPTGHARLRLTREGEREEKTRLVDELSTSRGCMHAGAFKIEPLHRRGAEQAQHLAHSSSPSRVVRTVLYCTHKLPWDRVFASKDFSRRASTARSLSPIITSSLVASTYMCTIISVESERHRPFAPREEGPPTLPPSHTRCALSA